ncbi:g12304 [Coccomyxa viridis]|uniref:G12304 protein n=1 Tax=Coccomyxa viridis TaxID=1274662 RepID=A0ABP1GA09_9CHLO
MQASAFHGGMTKREKAAAAQRALSSLAWVARRTGIATTSLALASTLSAACAPSARAISLVTAASAADLSGLRGRFLVAEQLPALETLSIHGRYDTGAEVIDMSGYFPTMKVLALKWPARNHPGPPCPIAEDAFWEATEPGSNRKPTSCIYLRPAGTQELSIDELCTKVE